MSKNLTLDKLAKEFNSTKGTFSNLENAKKNPSVDMILSIANYFDVSVDYLLGRTDNSEITKAAHSKDDNDVAVDNDIATLKRLSKEKNEKKEK